MTDKNIANNQKSKNPTAIFFVTGTIFIVALLFGINQIFATFMPGAETDPNCLPAAAGCTVAVESALFNSITLTVTESPYTVIDTDQIIKADTTGGDIEINLPDLSTFEFKRTIVVQKTNIANVVYINTFDNTNKINDRYAIQITENGQTVKLESVSATSWLGTFSYESNPVTPLNVRVATTADLGGSYDNGTDGVGATIVIGGGIPVIDGVTLVAGDRLLVKDQTDEIENGIYAVVNGTTLMRSTDSDETSELNQQIVIPSEGSNINKVKKHAQQTSSPILTDGLNDVIVYSEIGEPVTQTKTGTQISGQIVFWMSNLRELSKGSSQLFWNSTKNALGINFGNTASIKATLHVRGDDIGRDPNLADNVQTGLDIFKVDKNSNPVALSNGGRIKLYSGDGGVDDGASSAGQGGEITLRTGDGGASTSAEDGGSSGSFAINTGDGGSSTSGIAGNGGSIKISGGTGGTSGNGIADYGHGGNIRIEAGEAACAVAGCDQFQDPGFETPHDGGTNAGNIYLNPNQYENPETGKIISYNRDKNVAIGIGNNPQAKLDILENREIDGTVVTSANSIATRIQNDSIYTDAGTIDTMDRINLKITSDEPAAGFANNYGIVINEPLGAVDNYSIYLDGTGQTKVIDSEIGAYLSNTGVWTDVSSKSKKENYEKLDKKSILDKIANIPIEKWNYITDHKNNIKHIGPYAEDFYSTFGIGDGDKNIAALDTAGVALAGIQALNEKVDGMGVELYIQNSDPKTIAQSIANILQEIGISIKDGVLNAKGLVANVISAKKVVTNNFEMVDSADGKTYCVSLKNGNFDKVAGSCQ